MRQLRDGEMLCKFGCNTIVSTELGDCEMCHPDAVKGRVARLAPIIAAALQKAEDRAEKIRARLQAAKERVENLIDDDEKPEEKSDEPAPKRRGRPAKEVK